MKKVLTSRDKQAIKTKKKIYDSGIKLMKEFGYNNITIEQIAKKAKVSVGTYYHYFKSKFDLYIEIFKIADEYITTNICDILESDIKWTEKIVEYFKLYAQISLNDTIEISINIYVPTNKMFLTKGRAMQEYILQIVRSAQENNEIDKSIAYEEITDKLFIVARGVVFNWCLNEGKVDLLKDMEEVIGRYISSYKI